MLRKELETVACTGGETAVKSPAAGISPSVVVNLFESPSTAQKQRRSRGMRSALR